MFIRGKNNQVFCMPLASCLSILVGINLLRDELTLAYKTHSTPIMLRDPRDRSKLLFFEKMFPGRIRSKVRQTTSEYQFLRLRTCSLQALSAMTSSNMSSPSELRVHTTCPIMWEHNKKALAPNISMELR